MKNFTKQNFKTNPLWIRLLIMTFMLVLSAGGAMAANTVKSDGSYRLYFKFSGGSTWWNGSGCYHYAWVWANGGNGQIQRIYKVGTTSNASTGNTTDVFYMNIPKDMTLYGMILFRGKNAGPANGSTTYPDGNTYSWHNKTNDIVLPNNISTYNLVTAVTENSTNVTQTSRYTTVSVATTSLTASNAKSGSGTQADPYVFDENTTMKLSASATIDDHNFQIQLAYGSSTSMKTSGSSQSIDVALTTAATATAYTVTYTPCLGGSTSYKGTASTKNIYYKTEKACDDVAAPTLSIERGITDNCGDITNGIIAITNYNIYSNCTFTLNGNAVTPTDAGKIEGVTASGSCTVVVTNNCGNSSEPVSIDMPKTTVKAPTVYDVSLTYPQVSFATNNGSVNINLSQSERDVTYYLYKNGTKVTGSDKQGDGRALTWSVIESGTYTVKAANPCDGGVKDMNGSVDFTCMSNLELAFEGDKSVFCPGETANIIVTFNGTGKGDEDTNTGKFGWQWSTNNITYTSVYLTESGVKVPVTIKGDGSISLSVRSCDGTVNSNELKFTVTPAPEIGVKVVQDIVKCGNNITQYGQIQITGYNPAYTYKIGNDVVEPNNEGIIDNLSSAGTFTLSAINSCNAQTPVQFTISSTDNKPYITGATYTQPGKDNAIELTLPAGISAKWSVSPAADLSVNEGNSTMFSAEENGTYTITADNKGCTDTHVVTVSDAFYIWIRNAKEGETAYNNFYYPDQNSPEYRGGAMYYAECDVLPTDATYTTYNEGGREADLIQNDCDGYTWYGFRASADVISGEKYFYVRAKNDKNTGGWYTHTVPTKVTLTSDVYYTLCETSVNNCNEGSKGWKIVSASAPYAGPVVHATDASFNKNNFADFAALYVTDCSGKEIASYQWYKDGEEYSSICNYSIVEKNKDTKVNEYKTVASDAGKTNNIRPKAAGNYTCKATYTDGTSVTSAPFSVSATSETTYTDFKSNLPVIMVNTGSKNFPTCPKDNETASKNAEKMKKKLSVDVKILSDGNIVYDRKARMAYRGSSSLNFQKKSYAFCPGDANCGDADKGEDYVKTAKLNMLGIGEACDKDWVLYAAAADPSMLRNRMVFDTYQAMRSGEWGVNSRYVELIINGEYKGVYVMMDKITQNEKRVNIEWKVKDGEHVKKGFILKFDKTDIADRYVNGSDKDSDEKTFLSKYSGKYDITTYDAQVDQAFEIEYPEKEDIEDDGGNWYEVVDFIKGMINDFETALAAGEYGKVQQYIDYTSWADWFILSEYTKNVDAFRASCVFTYDGNKIKATPLWDQELSFNNQSPHANRYPNDGGNKGCQDATGLLIKHNGVYSDNFAAPFWFTGKLVGGKGTEKLAGKTFTGALLNDPCFVQTVKDRWAKHKTGALSKSSLDALITNYEKELTESVRTREANFWSSNGYSRNTLSCSWNGNSTGYYDDSYATAKGHITDWISDVAASGSKGRRAGLSSAIDELVGTGLSILFTPDAVTTTPWMPVTLQIQNESGYEYTLEYTDNALNQQPNILIEKSGDTYKYHIPRPESWGIGDAEEGERPDIVYGLKATLLMTDATVVCGSQEEGEEPEAPSATATITLQDEDNDGCE